MSIKSLKNGNVDRILIRKAKISAELTSVT